MARWFDPGHYWSWITKRFQGGVGVIEVESSIQPSFRSSFIQALPRLLPQLLHMHLHAVASRLHSLPHFLFRFLPLSIVLPTDLHYCMTSLYLSIVLYSTGTVIADHQIRPPRPSSSGFTNPTCRWNPIRIMHGLYWCRWLELLGICNRACRGSRKAPFPILEVGQVTL